MDLDIYWITLLTLLPTVVVLIGRNVLVKPVLSGIRQWRCEERKCRAQIYPDERHGADLTSSLLNESEAVAAAAAAAATPASPISTPSEQDEAARFCRSFLCIYLLVMSSEWLSGPYLYTLLRIDRGLPESIVCALYATAYTSAAVSALVVGFLADRFGRRRACLAQCVVHATACLTVVLGGAYLPVLFLGRVLAGAGLTLLWTVFESWMVTEWNARGFDDGNGGGGGGAVLGGGLSAMFGTMTTANCMTAIVGGVLGYCMVHVTGSKVWPFCTGIVLEGVAAVLMLRNMNENYGVGPGEREYHTSSSPEINRRGRLGDARIWALTFVTCCFEGTGFLVIFFWPSVLQAAHNLTPDTTLASPHATPNDSDLPYGVIFASFMAAMILGALLFKALSGSKALQLQGSASDSSSNSSNSSTAAATRAPVCLLIGAVVLAGVSLSWLSMLRAEFAQFCAFLAFEVANGVYVPSMAYARGLVVGDKSRAGLYGLMKLPLFVFVILALGITAEDNRSRRFIFVSASFFLLLAVLALALGFRETFQSPKEVLRDAQDKDEFEASSTGIPRGAYAPIPEIFVEEVTSPIS